MAEVNQRDLLVLIGAVVTKITDSKELDFAKCINFLKKPSPEEA